VKKSGKIVLFRFPQTNMMRGQLGMPCYLKNYPVRMMIGLYVV
jgi:hypothetical protein